MPPDPAPEGWGEYRLLVVETLRDLKTAIGEANTKLDNLRRDTVTRAEHEEVARKVDTLWTRDLEARPEWEEMGPRVRTMWDERTKRLGAAGWGAWLWRAAAAILGLTVGALTAADLLHRLGLYH